MTRQFENEANPDMHSRTTARARSSTISKGEKLDYWVTGFSTGGTLKGVARVLATERPDTKIAVCEPEDGADANQRGHRNRAIPTVLPQQPIPNGSRIRCRAGSPDFIPKLTGDAVEMKLDRQDHPYPRPRGAQMQPRPGAAGRIFVGIHLGRDLRRSAQALRRGAQGLDRAVHVAGYRRTLGLSTPLFADVPADMTEEEVAICNSTPGSWLNDAGNAGAGRAGMIDLICAALRPATLGEENVAMKTATTSAAAGMLAVIAASTGAVAQTPYDNAVCRHGADQQTARCARRRATRAVGGTLGGACSAPASAPRSARARRGDRAGAGAIAGTGVGSANAQATSTTRTSNITATTSNAWRAGACTAAPGYAQPGWRTATGLWAARHGPPPGYGQPYPPR